VRPEGLGKFKISPHRENVCRNIFRSLKKITNLAGLTIHEGSSTNMGLRNFGFSVWS
jgi:hypothetical protein